MQPRVYALATMDTKGEELAYVAQCLQRAGLAVTTVDVGTRAAPAMAPDIDRARVASFHPQGSAAALDQTDRGRAVAAMSVALEHFLRAEFDAGHVAGAIGLGGSGGTSLIAPALRALPIGTPKILVSTVASGNVAGYVGSSDLLMFPSIVDIAGLNRVSRQVLARAAAALAGMLQHPAPPQDDVRPAIGMTMFGVTTPCVDAVRRALDARGFDCLVFHATGVGGRSMEKLVEAGLIQGVLDITTTEVADQIVGGIFPAGEERFDTIVARGVPYVVSVGALDMVNFGALESVPAEFRERRLHVHNPNITLMRTTPEENRQCARWIADKLNRSRVPIEVLLPLQGVSALDAPGQPFHDPAADAALFDELTSAIMPEVCPAVQRLDLHINDAAFAEALCEAFLRRWQAARPATAP